jgi:hypothetical protein
MYIWKFDNGYFKISQTSNDWLLSIHLNDGVWDKLGYYHSPQSASADVYYLDIEYDLPFKINLSTPLPMDLSEWEKLQSL